MAHIIAVAARAAVRDHMVVARGLTVERRCSEVIHRDAILAVMVSKKMHPLTSTSAARHPISTMGVLLGRLANNNSTSSKRKCYQVSKTVIYSLTTNSQSTLSLIRISS